MAGFTYGALHMLAWNAPLHSTTELILWRSAALYIMIFGPAVFTLRIAQWM